MKPLVFRPKIIFIDWFGTLSTSKFWGHLENASDIENNLFKINRHLLKPWMRGEIDSEGVISRIAKETDLKFETIFNEFVVSCKLMQFIDPRIPILIKLLKKKEIKVYIATDNMDSFDRWTIPAMKLNSLFDGIINSFTIKALKHDFGNDGKSLFFDSTLKREGVVPAETILIDDSEDKENHLTDYGINYRRISDENTFLNELNNIISL